MDVDRIEAICRENTARVLTAMAAADLRDYHFGGTEGYGYDDTGRDALERAFALAFGAEAALVRIQMVSGTHALACVLLGILRPGDLLVCAYGEPYDTLRTVIGISGAAAGSLLSMGVSYLRCRRRHTASQIWTASLRQRPEPAWCWCSVPGAIHGGRRSPSRT